MPPVADTQNPARFVPQALEAAGDQVGVSVGFLEIYQEEVYDLLTGDLREDSEKKGPRPQIRFLLSCCCRRSHGFDANDSLPSREPEPAPKRLSSEA
eukprot:COSAG04_NODE_4658_length_1962_cov_12.937735_4_plen_97_part_00